MGSDRLSKSELLTAAQSMLQQDVRERERRSQQDRRRSRIALILVLCLAGVGMASFIAARHGWTSFAPAATSPKAATAPNPKEAR